MRSLTRLGGVGLRVKCMLMCCCSDGHSGVDEGTGSFRVESLHYDDGGTPGFAPPFFCPMPPLLPSSDSGAIC